MTVTVFRCSSIQCNQFHSYSLSPPHTPPIPTPPSPITHMGNLPEGGDEVSVLISVGQQYILFFRFIPSFHFLYTIVFMTSVLAEVYLYLPPTPLLPPSSREIHIIIIPSEG